MDAVKPIVARTDVSTPKARQIFTPVSRHRCRPELRVSRQMDESEGKTFHTHYHPELGHPTRPLVDTSTCFVRTQDLELFISVVRLIWDLDTM